MGMRGLHNILPTALRLMAAALLALLLSACDETIHFYPEPDEPVVVPEYDFTLRYYVDLAAPTYYKEITYNADWERSERMLDPDPAPWHYAGDEYELRIVLEVYNQESRRHEGHRDDENSRAPEPVRRHVFYAEHDSDHAEGYITERLPKGEYYVLAWADYVKRDVRESWHYFPDNLHGVTTDLTTYPDNTHLRSAAAGSTDFVLDTDGRDISVDLQRPSGRWRIVATDLVAFYTKHQRGATLLSDLKVRITYNMFVGVAYNVLSAEPSDFVSSYTFTTSASDDDISMMEGTATLAVDYIFSGATRENHVMADITVLDSDGKEINTVCGVDIPLRRNRETVIRGNFLTKPHGEGMSIDEGFENEVVIHF